MGVKVTQVVKCLLCKHKGLSLSLGIYIKKWAKQHMPINSVPEKDRMLGAYWLASYRVSE